ncbi:MAG: caspase family protein [Bacteroidota bacterium]
MRNSIIRKAILIGCPGATNYLYGVAEDLKNMKQFLFSDKGGTWFPNEIVILSNPTFEQLSKEVHSTRTEYNFIYFSGHGFTSQNRKRMLSLNDKSIEDLFFVNKSLRQLIIIDACRTYIAPGISGVPEFVEEYDSFDGEYEARDLFDRYIVNSPHGKIILHSTQMGHYSYESTSGGYFTSALLKILLMQSLTFISPFLLNGWLKFCPRN